MELVNSKLEAHRERGDRVLKVGIIITVARHSKAEPDQLEQSARDATSSEGQSVSSVLTTASTSAINTGTTDIISIPDASGICLSADRFLELRIHRHDPNKLPHSAPPPQQQITLSRGALGLTGPKREGQEEEG